MFIGSILFFTLFISSTINSREFSISLESAWKNLDSDLQAPDQFGGKWILAGGITFKKKAKEIIKLEKIYLKWNSNIPLEDIAGSLYKKQTDKKFLPIEENIVADGIWNNSNQTLIFHFPHKCLDTVNTFYVVLTIPPAQEERMKNGYFSLDKHCLPSSYKECIDNNKLEFCKKE